jgi:hypothetical protein
MIRSARPVLLAPLAGIAVLALLAAGCGSNGSPSVASVTTSTTAATATTQNGLVAFSRCMRANGLPGFPEPDNRGEISKPKIVALGASRAKMDAANRACDHLLPPSGGLGPQQTPQQRRTQLADERSFARCMRSHGVARFPDPNAQGQLSVEMVKAQGIDVHSPQILRVVQTCLPASHGALTAAKVREALQNDRR